MEELEVAAERDAEAVHIWRQQYAQALYNCALNDVGNVILPKQLLAMQRVQQRLEYEHFMYLMMLWNSEWNKTEAPLEGPDWNKRLHAIQVHHEYAIFSKNRNYDWEHWTVMAQNFRSSPMQQYLWYILLKYDLCSEKPFLIKELK